jgi:glutamate-1-semialdehyde 2,1-aminomutase
LREGLGEGAFLKEEAMADTKADKVKADILQRYLSRTRASAALNERTKKFIPGGDTRAITFYRPYPFYAVEGYGCRLRDADGNIYIDLVGNMTALIHGHAHPHVCRAIQEQLGKGICHGVPVEAQVRLAETICGRVASVETLRFGNSGSEATLFCMRAARAFTGKDAILKIDGGYHGNHDFVQVNPMPDMTTPDRPRPQPTKGVPACVKGDVFVVPFNDLAAAEEVLKANHARIAAVIMEPMLGAGGGVAPQAGYLKGMRELADRCGVLLIFDEVISFRLHEGGLQTREGVKPDLTAFGKIIGGGFPVGAFGGRRDIMDLFDPLRTDGISHSGTFTGNAVTMAAGYANLEIYPQAEVDRINRLGERLAAGLEKAFRTAGIAGRTRGQGSLVGIAFSEKPLATSRDVILAVAKTGELLHFLHLELLNRGIYFMSRGMFVVSTPMTETEIDQTIRVFGEALAVVKPLAEAIQL